jgi:hypothetical protein
MVESIKQNLVLWPMISGDDKDSLEIVAMQGIKYEVFTNIDIVNYVAESHLHAERWKNL